MGTKSDSTELLILLRAWYSSLIDLLDTFFDEIPYLPKWIFLQYEVHCKSIENLLEIPGVSFLEDFKKNYRRPVDFLRDHPEWEEDEEMWNGVRRPEAKKLQWSLDKLWIAAGSPKREIPEMIEFMAEFDKNILSYKEHKQQWKDDFLKEVQEDCTPPPGVELEPMKPSEKIPKPPEVLKTGEVESGDIKSEAPKTIEYKKKNKVGKFFVFKNGKEISSFSLSGNNSQILQVLVKAKKSLIYREICERAKVSKFEKGKGLEEEKVKGQVKEELIPSFSTYKARINKKLEEFGLKIVCKDFRYSIVPLN